MKKLLKKQNGITLIALVITIIVLLILAGITIAMLSGENGILNRAQDTRGTHAYYSAEEQVKLAYMSVKTEIMAKRASNGTYNAASSENTETLGQKVAGELKTSDGWTVNYGTAGKIAITYTNAAIKAGQISESPKKPSENGKVEYEITLTAKDATLSKIDGVETNSATSGGNNSGGDTPATSAINYGEKTAEEISVGDNITIGTEKFKVIRKSADGKKITAMPFYNLKLDSSPIKQETRETIVSRAEDSELWTDLITFSNIASPTWGEQENIDLSVHENNLQSYIEAYETTLKGLGASNVTTTIGRYYESESNIDYVGDLNDDLCQPEREYDYFVNVGYCDQFWYWLGTSEYNGDDCGGVHCVNYSGGFDYDGELNYCTDRAGVRPLVIITLSD